MLRRNFLKEKLERGEVVLGTWSVIPSPIVTDIISSVGLDFIIIDSEHGPITFETAQNMTIACESRNVSPVMRVGQISEADILKALDIGVHCIQIPNIKTVQDVSDVVKFSKYPPIGMRGFSPFTRAGGYSNENALELTKRANENVLVAVNVEGKEAIECIDDILSIDGLDIVFIGLFDLSKALGIPGQVEHNDVLEYLKDLVSKINNAGKYAGTIATTSGNMETFVKLGLKYIVYMVDCEMIRDSYKNVKNTFERITKYV